VITHPTSFLEDGWIVDFRRDGFVVVDGFIDDLTLARLRARFEPLFEGEFQTGRYPDEWSLRSPQSAPRAARHIVNAWKSDRAIARTVLSPEIGELAATLAGWPGARLGHDLVCWRPEGCEADAHDVEAGAGHLDPDRRLTFVIALDAMPHGFDAASSRIAAGACIICDSFARGLGPKGDRVGEESRTIRVETLSSATRFRPRATGFPYGRYQRFGSSEMDETFFPIIWTREGHRSPSIAEHLGEPDAGRRGPSNN